MNILVYRVAASDYDIGEYQVPMSITVSNMNINSLILVPVSGVVMISEGMSSNILLHRMSGRDSDTY